MFTGVPELKTAYREAIEENGRRLGGQRPNQQLTKGHLNPSAINSFDTKFMIATYTFTNAVPQFAASNCYLTKFEKKVEDYAKENCGQRDGTLYLLTGRSENGLLIREGKAVQDSTNQIPKPFLTDMFVDGTIRLVTPRSIWTAVCCIWQVPGEEKRAESFAVMSNNQDKRSNVHQTEMSVPELEELLVTPHDAEVNLFPGEEECRRPENYLHYEESIDENRLFRVKKISQKPWITRDVKNCPPLWHTRVSMVTRRWNDNEISLKKTLEPNCFFMYRQLLMVNSKTAAPVTESRLTSVHSYPCQSALIKSYQFLFTRILADPFQSTIVRTSLVRSF